MKTTVRPLEIPALYCPIPTANHPQADAIDERSVQWLAGFGLYPDASELDYVRRMRFGQLATRAFPRADTERVQILSDFVTWTIFDDPHCDHIGPDIDPCEPVRILTQLSRVLEAPGASLLAGNPWIEALLDVRRRIVEHASPAQLARWLGACQMYCLASVWEAAYQRTGTLPTLDDYVTMRLPNGGVQMYTTLDDVLEGYELPARELARPEVQALTEMCWTVIAWDNDLFSHYKETVRGHVCVNLIAVLARHHGTSQQAAVTQAVAMRDRVMCCYLRLRARVLDDAGAELTRYIASLDRWIRANIDMSVRSERYLNPLNHDRTSGDWIELPLETAPYPSDADPGPLPFKSIAWWWRLTDTRPTATATAKAP